jgi:6-phosphogluconolactonase
MSRPLEPLCCETREEASAFAAECLGKALDAGLASRGKAALLASGGTTPADAYRRLATQARDWSSVAVGLVDERWVDPGDPRSNEGLLRHALLKGPAAAARFHPMKTRDASTQGGVDRVDAAYREAFGEGLEAVLLGMGPDGHTASWFPGAQGLDEALDPQSTRWVTAIDARDAPVAGDCPERLTVTLAALRRARRIVLLLFGEEKRAVLEEAMQAMDPRRPVSVLLHAMGDVIDVAWAP